MTQALAVPANEVQSHPVSLVQDIPLSRIQESKTNPRRQFDDVKLAELADNIRQHGVLQPVLVRPMPDGEPETYELVAGARRFRASKLAKRETIPASIRELTDTECLELQLIENLQRADVHELDEARGYAALMRLQPDTYSVETLAEKIGRSEKYVYARLRLMHLIQEAQEAFYIARLTVAHAFEIARLQPNDPAPCSAGMFSESQDGGGHPQRRESGSRYRPSTPRVGRAGNPARSDQRAFRPAGRKPASSGRKLREMPETHG